MLICNILLTLPRYINVTSTVVQMKCFIGVIDNVDQSNFRHRTATAYRLSDINKDESMNDSFSTTQYIFTALHSTNTLQWFIKNLVCKTAFEVICKTAWCNISQEHLHQTMMRPVSSDWRPCWQSHRQQPSLGTGVYSARLDAAKTCPSWSRWLCTQSRDACTVACRCESHLWHTRHDMLELLND